MAIDKKMPDQGVDELKDSKTVYDEEIELEAQDPQPSNVEMFQDGGAVVNFGEPMQEQAMAGHQENLAELLEDDVLNEISNEVLEAYEDCKSSRSDWEQTYVNGLDLLGFKYEDRTEPFQGSSGATHPVLAEAVTQFQALAYKELMPAGGPVRTQIIGLETPDKVKQSQRVKEFMNYQLMINMVEGLGLIKCYLIYHYQVLHLKKFITMNFLEDVYLSLYQQKIYMFHTLQQV